MLTIYAKPGAVIPLGREGENNARRIVFDLKPFEEVFGPGVAQLIAKRTGEDAPYPVAIELDGSHVIWTVNSADTAIPGRYGEAELRYMVGETLAKSERWATTVIDALGIPSETPPEPQQNWVNEVLNAAERAEEAAEETKKAEDRVHEVNENPPKVIDGTWWVWSIDASDYVDTYVSAIGPAGEDGHTPVKGEDYWTEEDKQEIDDRIEEKTDPLESRTEALEKRFADMDYGDGIVIASFGHNVGTQEKGASVKSLTLSWSYQNNKQPTTQSINGNDLGVSVRSKYEDGLNITMDSTTWPTWTLEATDERSKVVRKTAPGFTFLNGVYCGVLEDGIVIDSAAILTLRRTLKSTKAITFSANPGATQRIAYAAPSNYGTPKFSVGGFEGGFAKAASEFEFVNGSGYMEKYDVWLSDETGLGSTTVVVQ